MPPALSLQLYAVRHLLEQGTDQTLDQLAEIGFRNVEVFDFVKRSKTLGAALASRGMHAATAHAQFIEPEQTIAGETFTAAPRDQVFTAAQALGVSVLFDPWVSPEAWRSYDGVRRIADTYNNAAEQASAYGLRIGHHNHSQEFARIGDTTALEVFADHLRPEVALELDVYWVATTGQNIAETTEAVADRVVALHVKDGEVHPDPSIGAVDWDYTTSPQVPAGLGTIDLGGAFGAAHGAEYAVIEFDQFDGDVLGAIRTSATWLQEHCLVA